MSNRRQNWPHAHQENIKMNAWRDVPAGLDVVLSRLHVSGEMAEAQPLADFPSRTMANSKPGSPSIP
jgi:hypothetical protein